MTEPADPQPSAPNADPSNLDASASDFTDADLRRTILSALRLVALAAAIGAVFIWWKLGWQSSALYVIGAAISGSGLFEWLRLMMALAARMGSGAPAKPMGPVLASFFLRLGGAIAVLYVSLKYLHGSAFALVAGLALGVAALTFVGLRQLRSWTV